MKGIKIVIDPNKSKTASLYGITSIFLDSENRLRLRKGNDLQLSTQYLGGAEQEYLAKKILKELNDVHFESGRAFRQWFDAKNTAVSLFEKEITEMNTKTLLQNAIKAATDKGNFEAVIELGKQLVELEKEVQVSVPEQEDRRVFYVNVGDEPKPTPTVVSLVEKQEVPAQNDSLTGEIFIYNHKRVSKLGVSIDFGYVRNTTDDNYLTTVVCINGDVSTRTIKKEHSSSIIVMKGTDEKIKTGDLVKYIGKSRTYSGCYGRVVQVNAFTAYIRIYKLIDDAFTYVGKRTLNLSDFNKMQ